MDAEQERIVKQEFLKTEIIDQGYDADAFISFCEERKSSNIDEWTLHELRHCVSAFVNPRKSFENSDLVECKSIKPSPLSSQAISISVTKPEKKTGLFTAKTFFYYIVTMPLGWSVQRKMNDFFWLIEALGLEFPGIYIPIIKEKTNKQLEEPIELSVQVKQISLFLNYISSSDLLKRSPSLVAFLQEEDRKKFNKIRKNKPKKIAEVKNFSSADGRLTCDYSNSSDFSSNMSGFLDAFKDCLKKISHECKNLKRIMNELCLALNNYTNLINEISYLSGQMVWNKRPMKELYAKLSETMTKFSERVWGQNVVFYEYFHGNFKFFKSQGVALKNIFKEKDLAFSEIDAIKKKIAKVVEKDKAVPKEDTDKLRALKDKAGVYNFMSKNQSEKMISYYSRTVFDESLDFCLRSSKEFTGILSALNSFQDYIEAGKSMLGS